MNELSNVFNHCNACTDFLCQAFSSPLLRIPANGSTRYAILAVFSGRSHRKVNRQCFITIVCIVEYVAVRDSHLDAFVSVPCSERRQDVARHELTSPQEAFLLHPATVVSVKGVFLFTGVGYFSFRTEQNPGLTGKAFRCFCSRTVKRGYRQIGIKWSGEGLMVTNRKRKTKGLIVIADAQFLITEALKALLLSAGYQVSVAACHNELEDLLGKKAVSLVITDHLRFDYGSLKKLGAIKHAFPETEVLVLTSTVAQSLVQELDGAGIRNVAMKTDERDEILRAVMAALEGKKHYSREVLDLLLKADSLHIPGSLLLTSSELEIIQRLSRGLPLKEIALLKKTSAAAMRVQLKNIYSKLGVSTEEQLKTFAVKSGLADSIEYYI